MCLALSLWDDVFIMLINVKMPTIVGILTFMSRINFVLSWVEHVVSFITSGPDQTAKAKESAADLSLHCLLLTHYILRTTSAIR